MSGYGPRFGTIGVDRRSQRRLVKPSAAMLGANAHANALDIEDGETEVMDATGAPLGLGGRAPSPRGPCVAQRPALERPA